MIPPAASDDSAINWEDIGGQALAQLELAVHLLVLPISALNLLVLAESASLNWNLKCVLLFQSAAIALCSLERLGEWLMPSGKFAGFPAIPWDQLLQFCTVGIQLLGYVLLLERIRASTLAWAHREAKDHCLIPLLCLLLLVSSAIAAFSVDLLADNSSPVAWLLWDTNAVFSAFGLACFLLVNRLNRRKYRLRTVGRSSLSRCYQLYENVRTGRQLLPCFLFHFMSGLALGLWHSALYFGLFDGRPQLLRHFSSGILQLTLGLLNGFTQVTVVTFHPKLFRRSQQLLKRAYLCGSNKVAALPASSLKGVKEASKDTRLKAASVETEQHFRMLEAVWERALRTQSTAAVHPCPTTKANGK